VIRAILRAAHQPDTLQRYGPWWTRFCSFVRRDFGGPPPSGVAALGDRLLAFIVDVVDVCGLANAMQAIAGIAHAAKLEFDVDLWRVPRIRLMYKGLTKLSAISRTPKPKRDVLPVTALISFVSSRPAGMSHFDWVLAAAVLSVGIRCIRRADELVNLLETDLSDLGVGRAKLRIVFSKTDPYGRRNLEVPFERGATVACPIRCLDAYIRLAKGRALEGWQPVAGRPLFVSAQGTALSTNKVLEFVHAAASAGGVAGTFGGHTLRITGACVAVLGGMTMEQAMAIGGWKADSSFGVYLRALVGVQRRASTRMGL